MNTNHLSHIIIIGAGFAGLETARGLANAPVRITLIDKNNPDIYAYSRELNGKKVTVLLNFKDKAASVSGIDLSKARVLLNNYATAAAPGTTLRPYEAVLYEW